MTNFKWADVAHMYLKSGIEGMATNGYIKKKFATKVLMGINDVTEYPKREFTPILRHLEDMTEEEAREWFRMEEGKDWPEGGYLEHETARERWLFWLRSIRISAIVEISPTFSVAEFHWLISKGFDLFGLIESGEAIRKEVNNG